MALWVLASAVLAQATGEDEQGERGRKELVELVQKSFAAEEAPVRVEIQPRELAFGLALSAVEAPGRRVLATSGEEEALRAAQAIGAARALFSELTGIQARLPYGLTAFLLGSEGAKDAFLSKHPKLGPEARTRLAKLEGAGVPDTADWAWWEGDAEKRLDGMVRLTLDWILRQQKVTLEEQAWLHEGLGFYLTHALVDTRLTWFVPAHLGDVKRDGANILLVQQMAEPGADWLALARGLFAPQQKFDLEELFHLQADELDPRDYLRMHALAAYLVEVHRAALGPVITRVAAGENPRLVLEEALGVPLPELRTRLDSWAEHRDLLVARAEGRRSEAELLSQWTRLNTLQKRHAVGFFQTRVAALDTQQLRFVRAALGGGAATASAPEDLPFYDPKVHTPANVITRKRLAKADGKVKRILANVRGEPDPRAPHLAFDYDWGRATVVKIGDPDEPEAVFQNALHGLPPGADLARARVLAALDHPKERKAQAAFQHAYTDRDGGVYPLALFEMWATGDTIEMPDVDTLGIVHDVLNEWRRWVAPVPSTQHDGLYKLLGEIFQAVKRSRELRYTLADLYLAPAPQLRKGYETNAQNLQALWSAHASEPAKLAEVLPDGKGWESFLSELVGKCQADYKFYGQGRRRAAQLRVDAVELNKALGAALDQAEAEPPPSATPPGENGK
ncbi:MAG: hypothetical protein EXS08_14995 [Planctomycetes bacterium]|nr:hypothetical protein [Planctomycetota bacterium]